MNKGLEALKARYPHTIHEMTTAEVRAAMAEIESCSCSGCKPPKEISW